MKIIRIALLVVFVFSSSLFVGCKKSSNDFFTSEYQDMMRENALTQAAFDDVLKVAENILMNNGNAKIDATGAPLGCITTIDTVVTGPNTKTYTINFPECTSYDGKPRAGTMIVDLIGSSYNVAGSSLTIRFNDYFINGNQLGGKLIVTNLGAGVFKVVVSDLDGSGYATLSLTGLNKISYWKSTHKRTIFEGDADMIMLNNKYHIGIYDSTIATFEGISSDKRYYYGNPMTELLLDYSCTASGNLRYPIDGEILFKTSYNIRKVDYGDGVCDYLVNMYAGDVSSEFQLY